MSSIKKVVLLVGSPRGRKSSSTSITNYISNILQSREIEVEIFWILFTLRKEEKINHMLEEIDASDLVILATPLYVDSSPYITIRAMEIIAKHREKSMNASIFFPIMNSGFPERSHFPVATKIYERFATSVGFKWRGSLSIGSGEGLRGSQGKSLEEVGKMSLKIRLKIDEIITKLLEEREIQNEFIGLIPEKMYTGSLKFLGSFFMRIGNRGWKKQAKENGEDVMARPYLQ